MARQPRGKPGSPSEAASTSDGENWTASPWFIQLTLSSPFALDCRCARPADGDIDPVRICCQVVSMSPSTAEALVTPTTGVAYSSAAVKYSAPGGTVFKNDWLFAIGDPHRHPTLDGNGLVRLEALGDRVFDELPSFILALRGFEDRERSETDRGALLDLLRPRDDRQVAAPAVFDVVVPGPNACSHHRQMYPDPVR